MSRHTDIQSVKLLANDSNISRKDRNIDKLTNFLQSYPLFRDLRQKNGITNFQQLAHNFSIRSYGYGETIYNSTQSRSFNFIVKGTVMLYSNKPNGKIVPSDDIGMPHYCYKKLGVNDHFGEKMFLSDDYRIIAAKSLSYCQLIQVPLQIMYRTFSGYFSFKQLQSQVEVLRRVVALNALSTRRLERIIQAAKKRVVNHGTVLYREGDTPSHLIIVLSGQVYLMQKSQESNKNICISILSTNQALGFTEIIKNHTYYSTAVCDQDCSELMYVSKDIIREMFDNQIASQLDVYRYKDDWRRQRSSFLRQSASKPFKPVEDNRAPLIKNRYFRLLTETTEENTLEQFELQDRSKLFMSELETARHKRNFRRFLSQSKKKEQNSASRTVTSMGDQLFTKYLEKKRRQNNRLIKSYLNEYDTTCNPENNLLIVKPLYVNPSQAVKNAKRQLKQSRRHLLVDFDFSHTKSKLTVI